MILRAHFKGFIIPRAHFEGSKIMRGKNLLQIWAAEF